MLSQSEEVKNLLLEYDLVAIQTNERWGWQCRVIPLTEKGRKAIKSRADAINSKDQEDLLDGYCGLPVEYQHNWWKKSYDCNVKVGARDGY